MEQEGEKAAGNVVVHDGLVGVPPRVAVQAVLVQPFELNLQLEVDEITGVAEPHVLAEVFADRREEGPVADPGFGVGGVAVVAGLGDNGREVGLPAGDVLGEESRRLQLGETADDLPHREVVGGLHLGDLLTAEIHHLAEEGGEIGADAVGQKDADIGGEAGKAVLGEAVLPDLVEVAADVGVGVGGKGARHDAEVTVIHRACSFQIWVCR